MCLSVLVRFLGHHVTIFLVRKRFISNALCRFCSHLIYEAITVLQNSVKLWINVCYHNYQHFRQLVRHKTVAINNFTTSLHFVSASIRANIDGLCCSPAQLHDVNKTTNINCNIGLSWRMLTQSLTLLSFIREVSVLHAAGILTTCLSFFYCIFQPLPDFISHVRTSSFHSLSES